MVCNKSRLSCRTASTLQTSPCHKCVNALRQTCHSSGQNKHPVKYKMRSKSDHHCICTLLNKKRGERRLYTSLDLLNHCHHKHRLHSINRDEWRRLQCDATDVVHSHIWCSKADVNCTKFMSNGKNTLAGDCFAILLCKTSMVCSQLCSGVLHSSSQCNITAAILKIAPGGVLLIFSL